MGSRVIGIIPARYGSQRFPGKPLATLLGKSLIQHTYENAKRCKLLERLIVATDDQRIYDHVKGFGEVVMTSEECPTGSDRLVEVLQQMPELEEMEYILNIQGDEPMLDPTTVQKVADALIHDRESVVSTAVIAITSAEEAENPHVVKCVLDHSNHALYFSRGLIPAGKSQTYQHDTLYWRHLGIYGYRRSFLLKYGSLPQTPLQKAEDLEQLRILEHGYKIKVAIVTSDCMDVNTPEDLNKVEKLLWKQNTSS